MDLRVDLHDRDDCLASPGRPGPSLDAGTLVRPTHDGDCEFDPDYDGFACCILGDDPT